jgi:selenocysteine lyase/cysteine desulfurase
MVTFSLQLRPGKFVDAWKLEQAAAEQQICFRTGCFCNPGANEKVFQYNVSDFENLQGSSRGQQDLTLERFKEVSGGKSIGAIRVSFGYANNSSDVARALDFFHRQVIT